MKVSEPRQGIIVAHVNSAFVFAPVGGAADYLKEHYLLKMPQYMKFS